ncbi:MAG: hypothetical protein B9J98_01955 [Candidatus Terraquivivens tikiterensis]|uniref:tRNA synthetases class I catalytic domain-containing protein n=1 Tax=Candidatus Terraquivivens tikiterensis TaxID=1980982 RepID=A0A2R7Y884_9ARCH|nr:MAG: hypothetical protein B9J98_01955 [Candidatus Terraquivivens tikiterensis]
MLMFFEDMDALKLRRSNIQPRATMHILDMIETIKSLIEEGYAYEVDGNVYFDVSRFPDGTARMLRLDEAPEIV